MTVGFIRLDGHTVGIVANNPVHKAGCMDCDTSDKLSKMCRFCDAFNIPIVFLVDNPAYIPMVQEEHRGIIRHGCHALMCHTLDTVPMIHLVIRKAYGGGGGLAMPAPQMGSELSVAWPSMERGLMGPKGAVAIVRGRELGAIKDEAQKAAQEEVWIKEMQGKLDDNLRTSAQNIIDPRETRPFLIKALKTARNKELERTWRKHDCIVL